MLRVNSKQLLIMFRPEPVWNSQVDCLLMPTLDALHDGIVHAAVSTTRFLLDSTTHRDILTVMNYYPSLMELPVVGIVHRLDAPTRSTR